MVDRQRRFLRKDARDVQVEFERIRDIAESDIRKNNLTATTDPTVNDDTSAGYEPLSRWLNTATGEGFLCIDASSGAANWQQGTLTTDELGSAALADVGVSEGNLPDVQPTGYIPDSVISNTLARDKAYRQGNILGTVSQSSGVPTGSVIERGAGPNGEYVKFADGTLICTFNDLRQQSPGSTSDGLIQLDVWTYPEPFTSPPSVSGSTAQILTSEAGFYVFAVSGRQTGAAPSNTSVGLWAYGTPSATTMEYSYSVTAIGRWF